MVYLLPSTWVLMNCIPVQGITVLDCDYNAETKKPKKKV